MKSSAIVRDVFLIGGGHSHVLLIRRWAMKPMPGVRLTLISTDAHTPYSGMLPGLLAGHYSVDDIHVDLRILTTWAGVRFIEQSVIAINLDKQEVNFDKRPPMGFDVLSLDTGSTPDLSVLGAATHSTPVKPVHTFFNRWRDLTARLQKQNAKTVSIGVVGSGAGGFELITAMRHALPVELAQCHWFLRGDYPLAGRPRKLGELALQAAKKQGIAINTKVDVVEVKKNNLIAADGREFPVDEILWCTAAVGPEWAKQAGFKLDKRGFVATNEYLQSTSHPFVFATGDIGTQVDTPSLKAGVFAVRQAPVLFENIRRFLLNKSLKTYKPQSDFLSLMATGGKRAIACRGPIVIEANWIWQWKDHIDQKFMRQFKDLPDMSSIKTGRVSEELLDADETANDIKNTMPCKGCGAKVAGSVLQKVLSSLPVSDTNNVQSGIAQADDAAVVVASSNRLVQSVDHINAIVDDPYILGRIAALHAMSDVFTSNAIAESAQVLVSVPTASSNITERDLRQLMFGVVDALNEEGCVLVGGHSTQADELSVGLVVNGAYTSEVGDAAKPQTSKSSTYSSINAGDTIVLTQSLGTGILFAGLMQQKTKGRDIRLALQHMQISNSAAAKIFEDAGAAALTDITGFGLLGHIERMLGGQLNEFGIVIKRSLVPLLPGAVKASNNHIRSSLWAANRNSLSRFKYDSATDDDVLPILCDPQTGGGLCAVVPENQTSQVVERLRVAGYFDAAVIGLIDKSGEYRIL